MFLGNFPVYFKDFIDHLRNVGKEFSMEKVRFAAVIVSVFPLEYAPVAMDGSFRCSSHHYTA